MTQQDLTTIQRLLAEEFEHRGWTYDLGTGGRIAEAIAGLDSVDPSALASSVTLRSLARTAPTRADVAAAIANVLGRVPVERGGRTGMRILFVAAGPSNEARLRLDAEHRDVRSRIRASTGRDQISLEPVLAARATDLIDELNRHRPNILHLAGHGGPTGIALEDESGRAADVSTDQLTRLVAVADPSLRLVVLNTCESAHQASPLVEHVDAAIGMTRSIGDAAARELSAQLYSSLAEGVALGRAFEQARLQVALAGLPEDQTPQLFLRRGVRADSIKFLT